MKNSKQTKLEGLTVQRKATGEVFTITGKEGAFFLLNGGADNGGRDVMGSELCYYTRVNHCDCKRIESTVTMLEQTFVLADLFTVETHSLDIPEHIYESDPSLEWVACPCCEGKKWLEVEGNVWTKALFSDPRLAYAHRHLNSSYKVCGRCSGTGEVLDDLTTSSHLEKLGQEKTPKTPTVDVLIAKVESLLAKRRAEIKTAAKDPRSTPVIRPVLAVAA
jgi:hypothetical protein